jgi:hypothetical protein
VEVVESLMRCGIVWFGRSASGVFGDTGRKFINVKVGNCNERINWNLNKSRELASHRRETVFGHTAVCRSVSGRNNESVIQDPYLEVLGSLCRMGLDEISTNIDACFMQRSSCFCVNTKI